LRCRAAGNRPEAYPMKNSFLLSILAFLLLAAAGCRFQGAGRPAPSGTTVRILRHSDLPVKFTAETRNGEIHRFLVRLNRYREQKGLRPLGIDKKLQRAAQWMSEDMAAHDYLSHRDSKGRDPFRRLADFGYDYNTDKAENVAAGQQTAAEAFESWQSSSGHNKNMLDPQFAVIGIGFAYSKESKYGWYWATSFGGRKSR
jgi:uncharacterized protein YkwD